MYDRSDINRNSSCNISGELMLLGKNIPLIAKKTGIGRYTFRKQSFWRVARAESSASGRRRPGVSPEIRENSGF